MQRMIVTGQLVQMHSGILELTEQQAAARQHSLISLGEGLYQINTPVQFKRGEEFGYDGELNKELVSAVEIEGSHAAEEAAAAKAAEEAAAAKAAEEAAAAKAAEEAAAAKAAEEAAAKAAGEKSKK